MEVIYIGIRNSVEAMMQAAIQEDMQIIGLSILSGAHLGLSRQVLDRLREQGANDIKVVGGVIPTADIPVLQALGVAAVFPGGTPLAEIVTAIRALAYDCGAGMLSTSPH
jgi:methylmalonyl-CoA mutase, C-terminal domain